VLVVVCTNIKFSNHIALSDDDGRLTKTYYVYYILSKVGKGVRKRALSHKIIRISVLFSTSELQSMLL
jgi:hypothetical protein